MTLSTISQSTQNGIEGIRRLIPRPPGTDPKPAAETAAAFAGIHNENEFYSHYYLSEIFAGDVRETVER